MDPYLEIVRQIIESQRKIIGPVAINEANNSKSVRVDSQLKSIELLVPGPIALERLVQQYATLFGLVSVELSKVAVRKVVIESSQPIELPELLK